MNNEEEKVTKSPRRGPGGHGPGGNFEKAKDFKGSMLRLAKELNKFKVLIIIALFLAALGSVLSIMAPNKLSKLTDEISEGLVINSKNLKQIITKTTSSLNEEKMKEVIPSVLEMKLDQNTMATIMTSSLISDEDKAIFKEKFASVDQTNQQEMLNMITSLPESILNVILPTTTYKNVEITTSDKIALLKASTSTDKKNISLPDSIYHVMLSDFKIDKQLITVDDQIKFLKVISTVSMDKKDATKLYKKLDEMPKSIKKVVEPTMNMKRIKDISLFLAILYICSAIFTYIESISMTTVSNNFARGLRARISTKINKLPLKYFDNHSIGDILSRVTNDIDTIAQSMNQSLATLVSATTLFIGSIIMMFYTNWIMALTAIGASLFGFIFMFIVLGKSQKYFIQRQKELGELNGHIEEVYSGLNVVKAYNGQKESNEKFDELNEGLYDANRKSQFLSGLMMPMMNFIGNFGYVAVCIVGALLVLNDYISFGVIVAFISYVRLFTSPLSQIAQAMTSLQSTAAASERVFEFIDEEEMLKEENCQVLDKSKVKGKIEFDHVVFKYDNNDKPTIKDFSVKVKPGQKVAIVGPTGAGKTTMVNLLMKFYDIKDGDIKIDGVSIKDLTRENIHSLFTMVLQDTWLFNGTIKENIMYNRTNVDEKRIKEVCKTVGLDHFIRTLSDGYDTALADNESISSGQKQLLTIARGMIEDSPFLILDEATSNVDTRTEELVQKAMDKLTEGKTSFIIAHRLSTIKNADVILVMREGNIIEQGNHEELMKKNGFYADLYNSQFEL